ncbi:MAG: F0F1 ATP synthase subunit gamma [Mycoplasma sp.]|nr:F0F1 ATP synthase subunit gamma [Mycoplasma sp.]
MASLQETKSRLQSVNTTKKITKAMQLVATAKLKRAQSNLESIQEYYTTVYDTFQNIMNNVKKFEELFPKKPKDSILYIIITSDLGLCGGYNSNVLKLLKNNLKNRKEKDKVIVIGTKGITHLNASIFSKSVIKEYANFGDNPNYDDSEKIGAEIIAQFMTGNVKQVNLIYTKFINSVTFEAKNNQLLPIKKSENINEVKSLTLTEFEPSADVVLKNSLPLYISALIFGSTVESKVSEMSSRRTAMENATDNATELIKQLDLEYNRARQAAITQEISEIVGGSESQ